MKNFLKGFLATTLFTVALTASAAVITINDRDTLVVNSENEIQFVGEINTLDPYYSIRIIVPENQSQEFTITAPTQFNLFSQFRTDFDFDGRALIKPNASSNIAAGESWVITLDTPLLGNIVELYLVVTTSAANLAIIDSEFGGSLNIANVFAGTENVIVDPDPGGGGGDNPIAVSAPSVFAVILFGLLALVIRAQQRDSHESSRNMTA